MPPTPIIDAISVMREAVYAALDPLTTAGVYWKQAEAATLPYVVFQSQDGGGKADPYLNDVGWQGLVTVKVYATTQSAAETLLNAVAPGMNSLSATGYAITTIPINPIDLPAEDGVWSSSYQWRVIISRV